ncbi:hypothetical protein Tco_1285499 [Tanacetum coccineum]
MVPSYDNAWNENEEHINSQTIITSKLKISDEFLKILQDNAFNGMDGGDIINHIARVLEIIEWIKIPNVEINELRLHVFLKSLSGDAKTWNNTTEIEFALVFKSFIQDLAETMICYLVGVVLMKMPPRKAPKTRTTPAITTTPTTSVTNEQLKRLIAQGVADVLAEREATKSENGEDSHDSGMDGRR